jgi:hypothetical protein
MKKIEVKDQIRLPLGKCMELVLSGIQFRLFRAAITVAIVALAVAFLMTMLTESFAGREVGQAIRKKTEPRRWLLFWVNRISTPLSEADLTKELAGMSIGGDRSAEYKRWVELHDGATLTNEKIQALQDVAKQQLVYRSYFESLDEGQIRPLVGRARGVDIYAYLQSAENMKQFEKEYEHLGRRLPGEGLSGFKQFLDHWNQTRDLRKAILAGHAAAVKRSEPLLVTTTPDQREIMRQPTEIFAEADESLAQQFREMGYDIQPDVLMIVQSQARQAMDTRRLERLLTSKDVKTRLSEETKVKLADITTDHLFKKIASRSGAEWLVDQLQDLQQRYTTLRNKQKDPNQTLSTMEKDALSSLNATMELLQNAMGLTAEEIELVAEKVLAANDLRDVESNFLQSDAAAGAGGFLGFSNRTLWLIIVSFIVCVVGIANAMLMSVTERFREIATMKCLGATDGFIMINFILESCMQGLAGGLIGSILGLLLGLLRGWVSFGSIALNNFPFSVAFAVAGVSLVMGVLLSGVAAVYPAWVAARLAPMEAMRIE